MPLPFDLDEETEQQQEPQQPPRLDLDAIRQELGGGDPPGAPPGPKRQRIDVNALKLDLGAIGEDLQHTVIPDVTPRYAFARGGAYPANEAARDLAEKDVPRESDNWSTRTRALGFGTSAGRGILSVLSFIPQALKATFSPMTPEEARNPYTQAGATRYGPAAVERVRQIAHEPTRDERLLVTGQQQPPAEPVQFVQGLNPLPLAQGLLERDPRAFGSVAGMYAGGAMLGELGRPQPGRGLVRGATASMRSEASFRVLGLDPATATEADVMSAWRDVAKRTHPDVATSGDPITNAQQFAAATAAKDAALNSIRGRAARAPAQPAAGSEEANFRAREARKPPRPPDYSPTDRLANEARDLSNIPRDQRTPAQQARFEQLNAALAVERERDLRENPPVPVEESGMAPEQVIEERRRAREARYATPPVVARPMPPVGAKPSGGRPVTPTGENVDLEGVQRDLAETPTTETVEVARERGGRFAKREPKTTQVKITSASPEHSFVTGKNADVVRISDAGEMYVQIPGQSGEIKLSEGQWEPAEAEHDEVTTKLKPLAAVPRQRAPWDGNILESGSPYVSDRSVMVRRDAMSSKKLGELVDTPHPKSAGSVPVSRAQAVWDQAVSEATLPLEDLGHSKLEKGWRGFLVPKGSDSPSIYIDSRRLRMLTDATGFDELRGSAADKPIVAYRGGKPVGLIMPLHPKAAPALGAKKYSALSNEALYQRYVEIQKRLEASSKTRDKGVSVWVRKEEQSRKYGGGGGRGFGGHSRETGILSGTTVTGEAGRAMGRIKDDERILAELEAEFKSRGLDPQAQLERMISEEPEPEVRPGIVDQYREALDHVRDSRGSHRGPAMNKLRGQLQRDLEAGKINEAERERVDEEMGKMVRGGMMAEQRAPSEGAAKKEAPPPMPKKKKGKAAEPPFVRPAGFDIEGFKALMRQRFAHMERVGNDPTSKIDDMYYWGRYGDDLREALHAGQITHKEFDELYGELNAAHVLGAPLSAEELANQKLMGKKTKAGEAARKKYEAEAPARELAHAKETAEMWVKTARVSEADLATGVEQVTGRPLTQEARNNLRFRADRELQLASEFVDRVREGENDEAADALQKRIGLTDEEVLAANRRIDEQVEENEERFQAQREAAREEDVEETEPSQPVAGAPHNQAALQEDIFGKAKLEGEAQTELLPETAGKSVNKLKTDKIQADEISRVKREGAEPEGEEPGELELGTGKPTKAWPFEETSRRKVGETHYQFGADEIEWRGTSDGPFQGVEIRTRIRREGSNMDTFMVPSVARVRTRSIGSAEYVDVEVIRGTLSKADRSKLAKMAEDIEGSGRKAYVRQKGKTLDTAVGSEAARELPIADMERDVKWFSKKLPEETTASGLKATLDLLGGARGHFIDMQGVPMDHPLIQQMDELIARYRKGVGGKAKAKPDVEEIAREQKSEIPVKLRRSIIERLAEHEDMYGGKEILSKLPDMELVNKALEAGVVTPQEESQLLDVVWPTGGFTLGLSTQNTPTPAGPPPRPLVPKPGAIDEIRRLFGPSSRTPEAAKTARTVRSAAGELARRWEVAAEALKDIRKKLPKLDTPEGIAAATAVETGQMQALPENVRDMYQVLRDMLDGRRKEVQDLGTGKLDQFIENYLPHMWENVDKARDVYRDAMAKRPLEGGKAFLKQRSIDTIIEGMDRGLKPVTNNLVDMVMLKLREMDKYIMAHRDIIEPLKQEGLVQFSRGRAPAPGWQKINDNVFTVYAPRTEEGSMAIRGFYYAPEPVARIINNYLSPGLRNYSLYQAYMWLGNLLNSVQLGISAFHAGFITLDSFFSRLALGVGQLRAGRLGAAVTSIATSPAGPIQNVINGIRLGRAYKAPGSAGVEMARYADALADAGGRIKMDSFYLTSTVDQLKAAAKAGHVPKVLAHSIALVLRTLAWPVMEAYVPAMKRGVFYDLAKDYLQNLPPTATPDEVTAGLQKRWDSVDNRMGQVVYDNLFWNRVLRDALHGTVRAVGWDMGSIREIAGGASDLLRGKPSIRTDYIIALVLGAGLLGALVQYLYTGEAPDELKDLYAPRTGKIDSNGDPERVQLPTYMKDIIAFKSHPLRTATGKMHPLIHVTGDILANRDFAGNMVVNPHDPLQVQLRQAADYFQKTFTPISIRKAPEAGALSFLGITPAPRELTQTPAERLMGEFLKDRTGALTPEQQERAAARRAVRRGEAPPPNVLKPEDFRRAQLQAGQDPRVARFRRLSPEERQQVYALGNARERALWAPYLAPRRPR